MISRDGNEPLVGALVRVAVPATDMRFIRRPTDHPVCETTTGEDGVYELSVPVAPEGSEVSLDAFYPGFRSSAGTYMRGGDFKRARARPGAEIGVSFELERALYVAGTVLDERGKPVLGVEVTARLRGPTWLSFIATAETRNDGGFEVFDFPPSRDEDATGQIVFEHPRCRRTVIEDVYEMRGDERASLRIVMSAGRRVAGRLLDADGNPVGGTMVEAVFEDPDERKATLTDEEGRFILAGLPEEEATIKAHAMHIKQKVETTVELDGDHEDITLRLAPVVLREAPRPVEVLGMELVDLNEELREVYDIWHEWGALVLDPGGEHARLGLEDLVEGDCFRIVGEKEIKSVAEFVAEILAVVGGQDPEKEGRYSCRVVYSGKRPYCAGNNTQHLCLSRSDVKALREAAPGLQ